MKKILFVIALFNGVSLNAQQSTKSKYSTGFKLGYSLHTLSGNLTKSKPVGDFLAGFWFRIKMNKKWTTQAELLLLDKGIGDAQFTKQSPHQVNLHYFEIPVLVQYHQKNIYFEFGPGLGYMINYAEHLYSNAAPDLVYTYPFIRNELSFNVGIGSILNENWLFGLRLSHSILPVREAVPLVSKKCYNRLLAFSISRRFMKKKSKDSQER